MKYKYVAYDKKGEKKRGIVEANSLEDAKYKLHNLLILDIKPVKNFSFNVNISFSKNVKRKDLAKLFNILGLYLKASVPLIKALTLTKNQEENQLLIKFLDYLYVSINEGKSFYNAIDEQNIINIPEYIKSSIKVGEESGKLDIVLMEMSKFLKEEDKVFSKVSQAFIYPFFIIIVSIFMVFFMLTTVVPKIVKVFENLNQQLPKITIFIINLGDFLKANYINIIIFIIAITSIYLYLYKKQYKFRFFLDKISLKIPIISKIIISKELGRFSYLTYVLVNSGVNYIVAIKLSVNTIENYYIKNLFTSALQYITEGDKLSVALQKVDFNIDETFIQAIILGEETGEIKQILKNLSDIYFEDNQYRINTLLSIIEPLLIIIVGAVIGFIITALLLPMTNLNVLK